MARTGLLDADPFGRRKTLFHEEDGIYRIETRQDVSHIVEAAKVMADQAPGKDFRHVAFIPEEVLNQAFLEGWYHDKAAWRKWANEADNKQFRTWSGRL